MQWNLVFKSIQKGLVLIACFVFLFSTLLEPAEGATHESAKPLGTECCLVCHPVHHGFATAELENPIFLSKISSEVCLEEYLHNLESPVFPLFHPPQNLV